MKSVHCFFFWKLISCIWKANKPKHTSPAQTQLFKHANTCWKMWPVGLQITFVYRVWLRPSTDFLHQEAMFMGNGEQYIWKPPEEDEIITLHPPPLRGENGQGHPSPPSAKEVEQRNVHVCVCVRVCASVCVSCEQAGLWFVTAVFIYGAPIWLAVLS